MGASNVKMPFSVPTSAPTVTALEKLTCVDEKGEHVMLVADAQALVRQGCNDAKRTETVSSKIAKLRPEIVTEAAD
jgi:hypothetical protein